MNRISAKKLKKLGGKMPFSTVTSPKKAIRKVNPKRRKSEYARAYHSKARSAFVASLPCQMCFRVGPSDNAHVGKEGKGAGRKANYNQIAALCRTCHSAFDNGWFPFERGTPGGQWNRMLVLCAADRTEKLWLEHRAVA